MDVPSTGSRREGRSLTRYSTARLRATCPSYGTASRAQSPHNAMKALSDPREASIALCGD